MSDSGTLCSNLIRDVLSVHISVMLDDGTIKSIVDDYTKSRKTNTCSDGGSTSDGGSLSSSSGEGGGNGSSSGDNETQSLSIIDLGGLFIVVYIVWFIACLAAMINWYLDRRKKERKKAKFNSSNGNTINHHQLRLNENNSSSIQEEKEEDPEFSLKNTTTNVITPSSDRDQQLAFKLESIRRQMDEMQILLLLQK
jgi:hypothetical protein